MSVGLDGHILIAPNVFAYLDVSMATAKRPLSANVNLDGLECFVINPFVKKVVNMVIVASQENAFAIQDGLDPIVTNA